MGRGVEKCEEGERRGSGFVVEGGRVSDGEEKS